METHDGSRSAPQGNRDGEFQNRVGPRGYDSRTRTKEALLRPRSKRSQKQTESAELSEQLTRNGNARERDPELFKADRAVST